MNLPNVVATLRLALAPGLLVLALGDREGLFLGLFLFLEFSDWLDGKLAAWLDQRTTTGARLDTVADMVLYGALLAGLGILKGELFLREWPWMAPALAGYAASWVLSLVKFGQLPSYHAWSAKVSWFLGLLAVVALFVYGDVLLLRVAAVMVTVANLEAIALTVVLDRARSDVPSVVAAWTEEDPGRPPSRPG